jgi:hypothetical protein
MRPSHYNNNPQGVPGTNRQRMVSREGALLERDWLFMTAEAWAALTRMGKAQRGSNSEIVQSLVLLADKYSRRGTDAE